MTVLFRIKKDRFFLSVFFYSVSKSALELKACGITAKNTGAAHDGFDTDQSQVSVSRELPVGRLLYRFAIYSADQWKSI